jgi:hypothetical protein
MKAKTGFTLADVVKAVLVSMIAFAALGTIVLIGNRHSRTGPGGTRVDATCTTLQMALSNFRTVEGRWPVTFEPAGTNKIVFCEDNALVFAPLLKNPKRQYVDVAALLTKVPGQGVLPLNKALKKGIAPEQCPLGYLDPSNKEIFKYFKVTFNLDYDIVKVER